MTDSAFEGPKGRADHSGGKEDSANRRSKPCPALGRRARTDMIATDLSGIGKQTTNQLGKLQSFTKLERILVCESFELCFYPQY